MSNFAAMKLVKTFIAAATVAMGLAVMPASPASAAGTCSAIPQNPFRVEIGSERIFEIHYPLAVSCTLPILSATGYGTLNRNGSLYAAGAAEDTGGTLAILDIVTVCEPATDGTFQSHIGATVAMSVGTAVVPITASPAVYINCALF